MTGITLMASVRIIMVISHVLKTFFIVLFSYPLSSVLLSGWIYSAFFNPMPCSFP